VYEVGGDTFHPAEFSTVFAEARKAARESRSEGPGPGADGNDDDDEDMVDDEDEHGDGPGGDAGAQFQETAGASSAQAVAFQNELLKVRSEFFKESLNKFRYYSYKSKLASQAQSDAKGPEEHFFQVIDFVVSGVRFVKTASYRKFVCPVTVPRKDTSGSGFPLAIPLPIASAL
jgi:hypothetical protein